jgi:hypothetical protein
LEVVRCFDEGVPERGGVGVSVLDDPVVAKERKGRVFSLGSFGFITIQFLSLVSFVIVFVLLLFLKRKAS